MCYIIPGRVLMLHLDQQIILDFRQCAGLALGFIPLQDVSYTVSCTVSCTVRCTVNYV